tara:strand:+ start:896 stop:1927 length:1032 start_codon:yes stop_codon:yes gene_type:complete
MKKAFITGITGQDGGYLAELLLDRGYEVHAIRRRSSQNALFRIQHILNDVHLHYGDLTDTGCLMALLAKHDFDEIYNLGAQSHVKASFEIPEYTADVDALGTLRLLECIRTLGKIDGTRFYQASTSELFGKVSEIPQNENTPFHPRSPYGVAKQFSYWTVKNYREAYGLHGSNGILFNHESPWRGDEFVTKKIVAGAVSASRNAGGILRLGNLSAQRDWGHAKDYCRAMYLMTQQDVGDDYVIATGELRSVRDFAEKCFAYVGIKVHWEGDGVNEVGLDDDRNIIIKVDAQYFRPAEVDVLVGDATKARNTLGWAPLYSFDELIEEMVRDSQSQEGFITGGRY